MPTKQYCDLCNKTFISKTRYLLHFYDNDSEHYNWLLNYCQEEINRLYNIDYIELLEVFLKYNRRYYKIYNKKCGHESILRADGLNSRKCSHKDCIHKTRSKAAGKGIPKSESHRQHIIEATHKEDYKLKMSNAIKDLWKKDEFKEKAMKGMYKARDKHAKGIAESQKRKANKDEVYFKDLLEKHNIKYIWQFAYVDESLETVVDFYLPDYNILVYIDGEIHKNLSDYDYDNNQICHLKNNGFIVYRLEYKDLLQFINNLKRGDA